MAKEVSALQPIVSVENARVRINRSRVLVINELKLLPGQHLCLFGGNGAGKSLLSKLMSGQLKHGQRFVSYDDGFDPSIDLYNVSFEEQQRLWELDNRRDLSEYRDDAFDVGTTVESLLGTSDEVSTQAQDQSREILQALGIEELRKSGIRFLSSGQVRKVMLARALLSKQEGRHRLLVLDEPLEAVDKESQLMVSNLLSEWMDDSNSTLLLCRRESDILPGITHMALMENLKIISQGELDEVVGCAEYQKIAQPQVDLTLTIPCPDNSPETISDAIDPIRLENVNASYGDKLVLNNVSWQMTREHNSLIEGPNGCGKSTLLSLIDGENHKAYGQNVYLFGVLRGSGESVWDIKSHFGVISNEMHNKYVKGWKVLDVVVSGFFDSVGLYDDSGGSQVETATAWLEQLGIAELGKEYYQEISFGQQRLVLLARAMVKQPNVLILDEPCVGLDDYYRSLILQAIDVIANDTNTQIVYVSHTEGEAPACINQHIRFVPAAGGGFTLVVT